jgi:TRAP-type C4-dicarboxylate transport system substrate-binding protein
MSEFPIKIRWLIAHDPEYLFIRTAQAFAAEVDRVLPGQFDFEILTPGYYNKKYGDIPELGWAPARVPGVELEPAEGTVIVPWDEDVSRISRAWMKAMDDGKIHMSQTQITVIGGFYRPFHTLDLPFLFNGHEHVSRVLDGKIGDELCEELSKNTQARGLGFTYSGGYRIVGSNEPIESLEDLNEMDITTVPSTSKFFSVLAENAKTRDSQTQEEMIDSIKKGNAIETTYLRFKGKNILKTNHSMFMTTILISNKLFDSLTPEQQKVFRRAAKEVAKLERKWSVDDAEQYEVNAKENGITIKEVSKEEKIKMFDAAVPQYRLANKLFPGSRELVAKIKTS